MTEFQRGNFIERFHQEEAFVSDGPGDTSQDYRGALDRAPAGEPASDYDVRSIFDSRPINGFDFNLSGHATYDNVSATVAIITFIVPENYVMVPRSLHHWTTQLIGVARDDIFLDIRVNGVGVNSNIQIPVGGASDDLVKLFFVADEFSRVDFAFIPQTPMAHTMFWAHLYGNFILKTNRPANFEIANPVGRQHFATRGPVFPVSPPDSGSHEQPQMPTPRMPEPAPTPAAQVYNPCMALDGRRAQMSQANLNRFLNEWANMSQADKVRFQRDCGQSGIRS